MIGAGLALVRRFAADLDALRQLAKHDPAAAETIVATLVAHLRSARPESVSPMALGPPAEPIRDPRRPRGVR